jgi:hypothetical protein
MNEFEQKLQRQPLREIPGEWRAKILGAANSSVRTTPNVTHPGFLSTINHQLATLLWPHPKAWAGLAAAWVFIFVMNFSVRDPSPRISQKSAPPSPEVTAELRQQKLLFAELIGPTETHIADRQKSFLPRPRSECVEILSA